MAHIALINPRFEASFWGMEHVLPLLGKRANMPVASLPLRAALTPAGHQVTLLDENVEALDFDRLRGADIVGVTGMGVQRRRMREILAELKRRGAFTVVGGPWATVREDDFGPLADVVFVGEAEQTWPRFLAEWAQGRHARRYEQAEKTDLSTVPVPRWELLKMDRYLFGSLQLTRGCPFQCEFCDIIVTFGRRPRLKTAPQVIAELEALQARGVRHVFMVDDNLIGNKKAIRPLLDEVAAWQRRHGYPFTFFTEASLDLAEDPELMQRMVDANIVSVFVGIESPDDAALLETKKLQNVRPRAGTLLSRVRAIQEAGLEVWGGMILGFDADGPDVFRRHLEFVREARIAHVMVGMLSAIPGTPLHARLAKEGRLDLADEPAFGTNVIPQRMSREQLRDGYLWLMEELYRPEAYFDRVESLFLRGRLAYARGRERYWREHPLRRGASQVRNLAAATVLSGRLLRNLPSAELRREYVWRLARALSERPDSELALVYLIKCACHYHYSQLTRQMRHGQVRNSF
ncbi:MAG: DUF4070 domain-containing protein [Archangium sp.]